MNLPAIFLIVALLTSTPSVSTPRRTRALKVSASNILEDLAQRKKKEPAITSKELAAYANDLLEKRGFDYMFDVALSSHNVIANPLRPKCLRAISCH